MGIYRMGNLDLLLGGCRNLNFGESFLSEEKGKGETDLSVETIGMRRLKQWRLVW